MGHEGKTALYLWKWQFSQIGSGLDFEEWVGSLGYHLTWLAQATDRVMSEVVVVNLPNAAIF